MAAMDEFDEDGFASQVSGDSGDNAPSAKKGPGTKRQKTAASAATPDSRNKKAGKGSPKGSPQSRARGSPRRLAVAKCLMCGEPRYRKTRWCSLHRRSYDNMRLQAQETDNLETFEKAMEMDAQAVSAMQEWEELNPPSKKFKKKEVLNWAQMKVRFGQKKSVDQVTKRKPMDKKALRAWGKYKKGWDSEEIEEEWNTRKNQVSYPRDWEGKQGALRLKVDSDEEEVTTVSKFVESAAEQGSDMIKKASKEDAESLRYFAMTSSGSQGHQAFLAGKWNSDWKPQKAEEAKEESNGADEAAEDVEPGQLDAVKRTNVFKKAENNYASLTKQMGTQVLAACMRLAEVPQVEEELGSFADDKAFESYCKTSELRVQVGLVCMGMKTSAALGATQAIQDGLAEELSIESMTPATSEAAAAAEAVSAEIAASSSAASRGTGDAAAQGAEAAGALFTMALVPVAGQTPSPGTPTTAPPTPTPTVASTANSGGTAKVHAIVCPFSTYQELFQQDPRKLPLKNPEDLLTFAQMDKLLQSVLEIEEVSELEAFKGKWDKAMSAGKALLSGITKGDAAVKQHIANKRTKQQRELFKAKTDQEKKQLSEANQQAKAAADKLKAKPDTADIPITKKAFEGFTTVEVATQVVADSVSDGEPVLYKDCAGLASWAALDCVQTEMAHFGGTYKKATDLETTGRTQKPMTKKDTRDKTHEMLLPFVPKNTQPINDVSGGKNFEKSLWLYGFTEDMRFCGLTPQCASMVRVLYAGCMEFYMISVADLQKANLLKDNDTSKTSVEFLRQGFMNMNLSTLQELKDQDVKVYYTKLEPHQALYVPQAYLVLELSAQGPLIFGVRKSFMEGGSDSAAVERFATAGQILAASGNNIDRHNEVLQSLQNSLNNGATTPKQ